MRVPVVLLHGFLGRGADWAAVRDGLPAAWDVRAPDLPGHGAATGLDAEAYTMDGAAERVLAAVDGPADVVGYSMGGRLALHLAVTRPHAVRRLVVVSGSPGLRTEAERADRRALDAERAAEIAADLDGFLRRWLDMPLFAGMPGAVRARLLADRTAHTDAAELGRSLRGMGTGAQPWHGDALAGISAPAWAVAGALDARYVALADAMAAAGASASPPVEARIVPGAGHNVPAEHPAALAALLTDLLDAP